MRKILLSLIIMGLVTTVSIGVTQAYFSDQGVSSGNTFSAGTVDLKLSDTNETDVDNISASWSGSDMIPGGPAVSGSVNLRSTGTVGGNHVEIAAVNDCQVMDMDQYLRINSLSYEGNDALSQLVDFNGNGWIDLDDLEAQGLDNLALQDFGVNHPFVMVVSLRPETGDVYQGQSCTSDLTFVLNQDVSQ